MKEVQLVSPSRQQEWGWLAVANFFLGGAGTGFYLINLPTTVIDGAFLETSVSVPHDVISLLIVTLGFLCVAIETGRPSRAYYIFSRSGKSWISREVIAFTVFVLSVVLNYFFPYQILNIIAASSALGFMIIQGFIIFSERTVKAWNTSFMPFIFLSSGLSSGAGVALIFSLWENLLPPYALTQLSLLCVAFNLAIWLLYLRWYSFISLRSASESPELKRRFSKNFFTIAFGHVTPILLLLLLWKIQTQHGVEGMLSNVLVTVSGLTIIIGVAVQKSWIVKSAGYTRGVTLKI
jgi:DMSO reductase anchor subunit